MTSFWMGQWGLDTTFLRVQSAFLCIEVLMFLELGQQFQHASIDDHLSVSIHSCDNVAYDVVRRGQDIEFLSCHELYRPGQDFCISHLADKSP